jgi:hypothetical protein
VLLYIMSFNEYYQFYLERHQHPWNRRLHIVGNLLTLFYVGLVIWLGIWWLLLLTPFIVYIPAFPGHWFFEGKAPAVLSSNMLWAKAADWRMMWDILTGKLPL